MAAHVHKHLVRRTRARQNYAYVKVKSCMRSKVVKYACGSCGEQLSGIGDWVEHVCPSLIPEPPAYIPQSRRRRPRVRAVRVHPVLRADSHKRPSEPPAKTLEQLLTQDDRAWMREIEEAFPQG